MAEILTNTKVATDEGVKAGVLSPTDKLAEGIKQVIEVFEENGIPKYKLADGLAKTLGSILNINGEPQDSVNFTSNPQTQLDNLDNELQRVDALCDALDSTKADKDTAFITINLGIQDLVDDQSFDVPNVERFSNESAFAVKVTDNITGKHRTFARTSVSQDASTITYVEVVEMGSKTTPSINELEVNVGTSQATYMEIALQPRLPRVDLDNIAKIPQLPTKTEINDSCGMVPFRIEGIKWDTQRYDFTPPSNGFILIEINGAGITDPNQILSVSYQYLNASGTPKTDAFTNSVRQNDVMTFIAPCKIGEKVRLSTNDFDTLKKGSLFRFIRAEEI